VQQCANGDESSRIKKVRGSDSMKIHVFSPQRMIDCSDVVVAVVMGCDYFVQCCSVTENTMDGLWCLVAARRLTQRENEIVAQQRNADKFLKEKKCSGPEELVLD